MANVVKWVSNPMAELLAAYAEQYPSKPCKLMVSPLDGPLGKTFFPDDGGVPEVVLCPTLTYAGMMDILAHELAHVVAGSNAKHGEKFRAAYRRIHAAYKRRITAKGPTVTVPTGKKPRRRAALGEGASHE